MLKEPLQLETLPATIKNNIKIQKSVLYKALSKLDARVWRGALKAQKNIDRATAIRRKKIKYLRELSFYKVFDPEKHAALVAAGLEGFENVKRRWS